jgi:hypothetical protein
MQKILMVIYMISKITGRAGELVELIFNDLKEYKAKFKEKESDPEII